MLTSPFSSRTSSGGDLCRLSAFCLSLSSSVPGSFWCGRPCFLDVLHPLWLLHSLLCLWFLHDLLSLEGKDLMEVSHLRLVIPRSLTLHNVYLWVSVFDLDCWRKKLLCCWLNKALIYEDRRMLLGDILMLCSFPRSVVFDFSLGPWAI